MTNAHRSTHLVSANSNSRGFALPTILIASIVMLLVLLASVTSTTAVRTAMKDQYYAQLAQVAGEAGVAYAQACLDANGRKPLWSNNLPLKSNTNCSGVEQVGCPSNSTNILCSVVLNGNVRSNFSIGLPPLDSDGRATTIPNTGYVEVLRTSNKAVWRKYNQKSAPTAVVPDLCSGTASGVLGWNNAVATVPQTGASFPEPTAQQISNVPGVSLTGAMYFRKDFSVVAPGTYTLSNLGDDRSEVTVDGVLVSTALWPTGVDTQTMNLAAGCHTVIAKVVNNGILANASGLNFSLKLAGSSSPLIVSDKSWRVAAGNAVHYSDVDYYADPAVWTAVRDVNSAIAMIGTWTSVSGDASARWISTTHSYDGSGYYPTNQFTLMRDNRTVNVANSTTVRLTFYCDDACYPYLDGNLINSGIASGPVTFTTNLSPGPHKFALLFSNGSGPSAFSFAAVDTSNGMVLSSTDDTWSAANFWSAANPTNTYSYDNSFIPNPDPRKADVLVVAGGGSGGGSTGGGGGAGGVISTVQAFEAKSYPVVIGAGGATPGNQAIGRSGANSIFNGLIAIGGGGGGYSSSTPTGSGGGLNGGSGGGGQNYYSTSPPGRNTLAQGNPGGALGYVSGSGGGGAGGNSAGSEVAYTGGIGGIGMNSSISGTPVYYAGGGGGGGNAGGAGGAGGGGAGAAGNNLGTNATANTGGGGGAGWGYALSNGGSGGSGIVIISYPTGSITATGGVKTTPVGTGRTIHTFTSNTNFVVTAVN